jgi:zinc transport system permease protein
MIEYIETTIGLMQEPFMVRAIIAGVVIAVLTAVMGVFVTLKKESFIADAVSHASLAGVAFALAFFGAPILVAIFVAVVMSMFVTYLKLNTKISVDSIIGIIYPFLFAVGLIILFSDPGYKPEVETYLFGNILYVTNWDIILALGILGVVVFVISLWYKKFLYVTFDSVAAKLKGVKVGLIEYVYAILTAVTIIMAIRMAGIVMVTALLVLPAVSAKVFAKSFKQMIPIALIHNLLAVLIGIFFSTNLPPGPVIVVTSSIMLLLGFLFKRGLRM